MPRGKKGKTRAPVHAQEEGGELEPIPEDAGYEGYDNYGQSGDAWQNEATPWQGHAQGDQWGHQPGPQAEGWDTGQHQQQQQEWGPPTNSPAPGNAPTSSGPAAFAAWGRNPQGAYGPPPQPPQGAYGPPQQPPQGAYGPPQQPPQGAYGPPPQPPQGAYGPPPQQHHVAQHPPPTSSPPGVSPSRSRQDPGVPAPAPSWHNWGAEAMANRKHLPLLQTQLPATGYGQQGRVAFASHDSYVPFVSRDENTPQGQQMIFDSIMNSRGRARAPKQPQQRSAQNSTHPTKHSKKSKREKRVQEQSAPDAWDGQQQDYGWEQDNSGWEQDNSQWDKQGYGFSQPQQEADWGGKQDPTWDQWASGDAGRDDLDSEGYTDGDGWNDVTGRRKSPRNMSNTFYHALTPQTHALTPQSPYPVSSRTMAYANGMAPPPIDAQSPAFSRGSNTIYDYTNLEPLESLGEALKPVELAFFGRERKARDRIHWQFPHDKDERVRNTLEWLYSHARSIASFGLDKFLETRERGALFINASYDSPTGGGPGLEWLSYDDVVETRDRLLQESVGFYDPSTQVIVFVFLPSKTGNSLAMWRRKIAVPDSLRLRNLDEIDIVRAALRKDYAVLVDEMRSPPYRLSQISSTSKKKKKKKGFFRRLFRVFKIVW